MKWRVVPLGEHTASMNMAMDEAVSESVANGAAPTIRFYRWRPSAVSIGYFQSLNDEVNAERCRELGVDIVRRRTGGGAVFHSNSGEITYSVIGKEELFPKNIIESYKLICGWVIKGLGNIGIDASFVPINDIIAGGRKISGNAQTRRNSVLLQHGTVLYDVDVDTMFSLLKVPDEKMRDKIVASVKDRVTRVLNFSDASMDGLYNAMLKGFTDGKDYKIEDLSLDEKQRAEELSQGVYSAREWNYMR